MKMETKQEIFDRYKQEYYKAKGFKEGRGRQTEIIDIVKNVTKMGRKSIIRAFNRIQLKDPYKEDGRGRYLHLN